MRQNTLLVILLVLSVAAVGFKCLAIDVTEVGIQVHVMHDPVLSGGELRLAVAISGYCRLFVDGGWTMRAQIGSLLDLFLPQISLAMTHAMGDRWAVEAQLWAKSDLQDSLYVTLSAGGRVLLAGSETSQLMLSSFPVTLGGLYYWPGEWSFMPGATLNAYLDYAWTASEKLILGQTIGLSIAQLSPELPMAFPLDEAHGLVLDSMTRAGYRP